MFLQIYNTDTQWFIFALIRNEVKRRIFLFGDPQNCANRGRDMKNGSHPTSLSDGSRQQYFYMSAGVCVILHSQFFNKVIIGKHVFRSLKRKTWYFHATFLCDCGRREKHF